VKALAIRRSADELAFLPAAVELIETPASPAGRATALVIAAVAVTAIIWASFAQLDIITSAAGRIVPEGRSKIVQPFQEGIVQAILVNDGDHVAAGQVLVTLDPTAAAADAARLAGDLHQAELDRARLMGLRDALATGAAPRLTGAPAGATPAELAATAAQMQAQALEQAGKLANIDQQIAEKQSEVRQAQATIDKVRIDVPFLQQIAGMRTALMKDQVGSRLDWLNAQQQLAETGPDIALAQAQQNAALADADALQQQRAQTQAEYAKDVLSDLEQAEQKINQSSQDLVKAQQQVALTSLRAPITGTVQQLAIHTVGGVVTPAQALLTVVPDGGQLMVEASIQNQDIGFVHTGQDARIKIGAFDFTRYGMIDGRVVSITRDVVDPAPSQAPENDGYATGADQPVQTASQSAAAPPPREPGYVAHITLAQTSISTGEGLAALQPGMAVTADIQTGRRSVMSYLLSPFARQIDEAGQQR
jgi:hemolysin D